jgi:hypothetical protein
VLSTQVSTAGLRLRHNRLACGIMLKVSREAVAAGEEQLVSCSAERRKYCFICTVTLGPCGDLPFTSWGRWQCLRGGADAGLDSCYAASRLRKRISIWGPAGGRRVATCLRRWRALPLRSSTRRWRALPLVVQWFKFLSTQARFFGLDLIFFSKVQIDSNRKLG